VAHTSTRDAFESEEGKERRGEERSISHGDDNCDKLWEEGEVDEEDIPLD